MAKVHSKELSKLLDHGEDYTLDYKESDKLVDPGRENRKDIARHLVGLANRDGGQLVFGVEDESRKPDGTNIRREEAEGTLSEIVEDWCSPPIDYRTEAFYSSASGDLTEGSVLVIRVEPTGDIPAAVVDNKGDKIRKREYRIRTGDQTRLVADEELRQMFLGQLEPDVEDRIKTWYFYTADNPTPGYHPEPGQCQRPLNASVSQNAIAQYLTWLSDKDKERWIPEGARGLGNIIREIIPIAIINQLSDSFRDTWHIEWKGHKIDGHGEIPDVPTETLEIDRSKFDSHAMYNLEKTDLDWYSQYVEYGNQIVIPAGTDVRIVNKGSRPVLVFEKDDIFTIELGMVMERYDTIPTEHPRSGVKIAQQKFDISTNINWLSLEYDIKFDAEYGFPDVRDTQINSHKSFGDQIRNVLYHFWSTDVVTEDLPDNEVYEINEKVDLLLEGMNRLVSPGGDQDDS